MAAEQAAADRSLLIFLFWSLWRLLRGELHYEAALLLPGAPRAVFVSPSGGLVELMEALLYLR